MERQLIFYVPVPLGTREVSSKGFFSQCRSLIPIEIVYVVDWDTAAFSYVLKHISNDMFHISLEACQIGGPGNSPWAFKGEVGLWSESIVRGKVSITGCCLIALRNDDNEWEPFDTSEHALNVFPFKDDNLEKHRVPAETMAVLAKNWSRMYAWFLDKPVKFDPEIPVDIKKGVQKIQSMDADTWTVAWSKFQSEIPRSVPRKDGTLALLGMGIKDAFQLLEGESTMMLKSYKPEKLGLIYVSCTNQGTAFLLGTFNLLEVRPVKTLTALRKLEQAGYRYHRNQAFRQISRLEAEDGDTRNIFAWLIEGQQVLHPPMTWKTESGFLDVRFRW